MRRLLLLIALTALACKPEATNKAVVEAPAKRIDTGRDELLAAFEAQRSKVWVEFEGDVVKTLPDDTKGSQHQRFIVDVGGHTVLVAHNIDLAPRVDVARGTRVRLRGRYEYNNKGGVVHWTHADPKGRREGGWVRVTGSRSPRGP